MHKHGSEPPAALHVRPRVRCHSSTQYCVHTHIRDSSMAPWSKHCQWQPPPHPSRQCTGGEGQGGALLHKGRVAAARGMVFRSSAGATWHGPVRRTRCAESRSERAVMRGAREYTLATRAQLGNRPFNACQLQSNPLLCLAHQVMLVLARLGRARRARPRRGAGRPGRGARPHAALCRL